MEYYHELLRGITIGGYAAGYIIDNILGLITETILPIAGILLTIYLIKQLKKK